VLEVLKLAGINCKRGACHRFRDTFAITLLKGGETLSTVCEFLGHSDVRITKEHYIKFIDDYRKEFAKRSRVLNYQFPLAG
jgi:site-specific recombinase XerD